MDLTVVVDDSAVGVEGVVVITTVLVVVFNTILALVVSGIDISGISTFSESYS